MITKVFFYFYSIINLFLLNIFIFLKKFYYKKKIKEIEECEVINLKDNKNELVKLKNLI